ncbi:uncharacterized protein [Nicotiana sylvestris]|uniref:uncharacterized protein n=1 Tax=Nicotiana sylvestris TaxID=4096 RepID=UPI00388C64BE
MTDNNGTESVEQDNGLFEKVRMLRQHMADMYQAWMSGKAPPPPPPSFLNSTLTRTPVTVPEDPPYSPDSPAYHGFPNHPSSSITHSPITSPQNLPPVPSTIPDNAYSFKAHDAQYCSSEVAHNVPNSYKQGPRDGPHVVNEEFTGRKGRDGIPKRPKGIEQSSKNKQGMGDQGSMSYKELSMSPDVRLPAGFKVPMFNMYDGCGDPVAHLRDYCNKMRSVGEKDDLLMAYFSENLIGPALECHNRQDVGKWPTLGDMAQDFVRHFQYRSSVVPDRSSLSQMEKKPKKGFRDFLLRWNEQIARDSPLIDRKDVSEPRRRQGPVVVLAKCFQPLVTIL